MNKKLIWVLATIGILANLFDAVTTFIALHYPHIYEVNRFMAFFFESYPVLGYSLKLVLGTWIFLPFKYCPYHYVKDKRLIIIAWVIIIFMFIRVGVNNILLI